MPINHDKEWDAQALKLELGMLENIRASAEKWTTTLGTLTGLVSIGTLLGSGSAFDKLAEPMRWLFALALCVALLTALVAIYLGALASQGFPNIAQYTGYDIRRATMQKTEAAADWLIRSRQWVTPALISALVASGILLFGRAASPTVPSSVVATLPSGNIVCGPLIAMANGTMTIDSAGKNFNLKGAKNLVPIDHCPEKK